MKKLSFLFLLSMLINSLSAQVRLDVEGDAKILGKMEIIQAVGDSSLLIGANAGLNDDGNNNNTFVGTNAGKSNIAGASNAFFGRNAGASNINATSNSFFGERAGFSTINGASNAFFGRDAGISNTTGASNAYFGKDAGKNFNNTKSTILGTDAETTGDLDRAIAIGHNAIVGCANCAVIGGTGVDAVKVGIGTTTPAAELDVIGKMAIIQAVGDSSLFIGANAGMNDDGTQNENTFVGTNAGKSNATGIFNTFFGKDAGKSNTTAPANAFFGWKSGSSNTTGSTNSFFGSSAGQSNTTGSANAFFGGDAGIQNSTGFANAFFGHTAGRNNNTGKFNAFFGGDAGHQNSNGTYNAYFGYSAGRNTNNTRSTLLGNNAQTVDSLDRAIAIGYNAIVGCDNCAVIGGTGVDAVKVGIGTTTPGAALQVVGSGFFGADSNSLPSSVGGGIRIFKDATSNDGNIFAYDYGTGGGPLGLLLQQPGGNVGIGAIDASCKLNVTGNICSNGNAITSDERFKKQIKRIQNPLAKIARLEGYTYQMRTNEFQGRNFSEGSNLGLLAQNVEKVFPELVTTLQDGYKAVNYDGLIPVLVEGMNEQQQLVVEQATENIRLKEVNEAQNQQLATQQAQIDELKSLVEKLLTQNAETPKSTSYVLPLEQQALLAQNHPNPFRENTLVDYFVPANVQNAHIQVTSVDGKVLGQVKITEMGKGQVTIQSKNYPAGTYFYSLVLDGQVMETMRMVLTR